MQVAGRAVVALGAMDHPLFWGSRSPVPWLVLAFLFPLRGRVLGCFLFRLYTMEWAQSDPCSRRALKPQQTNKAVYSITVVLG